MPRRFAVSRLLIIGASVAFVRPALAEGPPAMTGGDIPTKVRIRNVDSRGLDRLAFARWLKRHPGMQGLAREDAELKAANDDKGARDIVSAMFEAGDMNKNGYMSAEELKNLLLKRTKNSQ